MIIYLLALFLVLTNEIPEWLINPPQDGEHFYGFAWANIIDGDENKALAEARENAILNLASKIKIRVKGTIRTALKVEEKGMTETQTSVFEREVTTQVDISLTKLEDHRKHIDRKHHRVGVMVRINMVEYERNLKRELEENKSRVLGYITVGDERLEDRNGTLALKNYLYAYVRLENLFQNLPVYEDMDGDGIDEELHPVIQSRIENMLNKISLSSLKNNLVYSVTGALGENIKIKVIAEYYNEIFPCRNFPLKDSIVLGKAVISPTSMTMEDGIAEFRIGEIDPKYETVIVRIKPDLRVLVGIGEELPRYVLPYTEVTLLKQKTVALSVYFKNAGTSTDISSFYKEIEGYLLRKKFGVVQRQFFTEVTNEQLVSLSNEGIDLVITVNIETKANEIEEGLYVAYANAVISLYSARERSLIVAETISSTERTFGGSATQSGLRAYTKIKDRITQIVKSMQL